MDHDTTEDAEVRAEADCDKELMDDLLGRRDNVVSGEIEGDPLEDRDTTADVEARTEAVSDKELKGDPLGRRERDTDTEPEDDQLGICENRVCVAGAVAVSVSVVEDAIDADAIDVHV